MRSPKKGPNHGEVNNPRNSSQLVSSINPKSSPIKETIYSDQNGIAKIVIKVNPPELDGNKNSKVHQELKITESKANTENKQNPSMAGSSSGDPFISKRPKICKFFTQQRCKFGDRCFNFHPKNDSHTRKYVPPWYNDAYIQKGYQPPRVLSHYNYNPIQTQNRFHKLPLVDLDSGRASGYWSRPHDPQINSYDFPALNGHYPNGNVH